MDEIVRAALRKWPDVPDCHGWLALDARGHWYMRDERTQAAGPFPQVKGSRITHDKLREFIHRNYAADEHGAWYFQNGPQRVYVQLEAAPWIWRLQPPQAPGQPPTLQAHTGMAVAPQDLCSTWLDEHGRLFVHTRAGLGLVHTLDMESAAQAVEEGHWQPQTLPFAGMAARFGHVLNPQGAPGGSPSACPPGRAR
jgi:hypothetical protein